MLLETKYMITDENSEVEQKRNGDKNRKENIRKLED